MGVAFFNSYDDFFDRQLYSREKFAPKIYKISFFSIFKDINNIFMLILEFRIYSDIIYKLWTWKH